MTNSRKQPHKLARIANRPQRSRAMLAFIILPAAAIAALACAWSSVDDHSVRFNYERTGRGFYRLPPLPIFVNPLSGKELSTREVENYEGDKYDSEDPDPEKRIEEDRENIYEEARVAVDAGNLSTAIERLKKYLELTTLPTDYYGQSDGSQALRNTATDLLDALSALHQGASPAAVQVYAKARYEYDTVVSPVIDQTPRSGHTWQLEDNWAYLRAAALNKNGTAEEALDAFRKHAASFPRSEKHEAVLYMIAKLTMEQSHSFDTIKCGIMGKAKWGEDIDPGSVEPPEKCQDESWNAAINAFQKLMREYPNGRYLNDARGWLAFLYKRGGERAKALAEYYRLLGDPNDRTVRLAAKKSLQMIGHEYDDETLDQVEKLIADDANAALAYSYHRIYNHAIDLTYDDSHLLDSYTKDEWKEKQEEEKRLSDTHKAGNHELERVAKFATAMMKRYPQSVVSGDFVLRTAEAQLELQNFSESLKLSQKALGLGIRGDGRMEGLWVKGSSEHQLRQLKSAKGTFQQLIAEYPNSKLTEGARRLLAMTAEDQDDLETALELYLDLKYEQDVAYFIDVLLPTDRLAKFVDAHKNEKYYNQLLYAVGIRYMRDRRWNEARNVLSHVQTEKGVDRYLQDDKKATWYFPKEPSYEDEKFSGIKTSWVVADMKTIDVLEHYENEVQDAQGDENKAEAMYRLASCLFESDDLTFYNPSAWGGGRGGALSDLLFSDHERLPNETRIIFEHLQVHDPWARAIPIYLEIVDRYPQTKTAKDALYTVAVAHQRLSERNGPWGVFYNRGMFAGPRMVTYEDVKNIYPTYQLPRGTYGWQPLTRTVNGGPGWSPKPKPLPRLTITERVTKRLKPVASDLSKKIQTKLDYVVTSTQTALEYCFYLIMAVMAVLAVGYVSLLGIHFRNSRLAAVSELSLLQETDLVQEEPRVFESRVDKMMDDS